MGQPCIAMHSKGFFILKGLLSTTKLPMNWKANFATPLNHCYKALRFIEHNRDRFTFEDMLSNRYRLDQINEAMQAMKDFREVKPIVVP